MRFQPQWVIELALGTLAMAGRRIYMKRMEKVAAPSIVPDIIVQQLSDGRRVLVDAAGRQFRVECLRDAFARGWRLELVTVARCKAWEDA